jgi:Dyp-type peroxidase family
MAVELDLADIQGNVLSAYGKQGFPKGRFLLFHIEEGKGRAGRKFVSDLLPMVTTALRWPSSRGIPAAEAKVQKPDVAVNIAFTWRGLLALGIPVRTLRGMPDEFIDGMMNRACVLGDDFRQGWEQSWDEVWTKSGQGYGSNEHSVHILVTLNAQMDPRTGLPVPALTDKALQIETLAQESGGVRLLAGHNQPGKPQQRYQELSAILELRDGQFRASPKEHFGFTDGISDPVFDGQYPGGLEQKFAQGNGAHDGKGNWRPLATGEFLLGYPDEAQETAGAAMPLAFSRNGTFMAYRKLHQNAAAFHDFLTQTAARFGAVFGIENPDDARETLMAKMAGRWSDGVPVSAAPTVDAWNEFNRRFPETSYATDPNGWAARNAALSSFTYRDDPEGTKCPLTAHLRRANTRDTLDPAGNSGSALNNRRRILRRGLPYGDTSPGVSDSSERGIVMLIVCASPFRQFEFVQQQWINYGLDLRAGNDTCPIIGNHCDGTDGRGPKAKFVIPAEPDSGHPPFIVEGIPQFVETRGGEYFFVPSMTALRMIAMGVIDPT